MAQKKLCVRNNRGLKTTTWLGESLGLFSVVSESDVGSLVQVSNWGDALKRTLQRSERNKIGPGKMLRRSEVSENIQPHLGSCGVNHTTEPSCTERRGHAVLPFAPVNHWLWVDSRKRGIAPQTSFMEPIPISHRRSSGEVCRYELLAANTCGSWAVSAWLW